MTVPTIQSAKAVSSAITSIAKRGAKLDADIHACAVQCLLHFETHGDATLATRLYKAMPRSGRAEALKVWFGTFAPLVSFSRNASSFCSRPPGGPSARRSRRRP